MFFYSVSVHKRKKISKSFNIYLAKILNFNSKKKGAIASPIAGRGEEVCHWSKEVCNMGTTRKQERAMVEKTG
jgi:hypothetical protein